MGHPYKLFKKHSTIRSRQTFFSERVINVWNYLPYDIVCFKGLNAFKRSIECVDFKSFFYNVTSLVHSYIVITVFARPTFRAIVSALWCLLVLFHHVRICSIILSCNGCMESINWTELNWIIRQHHKNKLTHWVVLTGTKVKILQHNRLDANSFLSEKLWKQTKNCTDIFESPMNISGMDVF